MRMGSSWQKVDDAGRTTGWLSSIAFVVGCPQDGVDEERVARLARADEVVAAHCASVEECDCSKSASAADCESSLQETWRSRIQAGSARGLTYDESCFEAIEAGIEDAQCAWPPADARNPCHDHCQLFHGEREAGQTCDRFDDLVSDCAQGLLCSDGRCVDPCARLSGLSEGEVCRDGVTFVDLDRCADGLTCLSTTGRCARAPAAGEPCKEGECDPSSYCDYGSSAESPLCRARVPEGGNCEFAPCDLGLECAYRENPDGTYQARCMAEATEGQPCFEIGCIDGLVCAGAGVCMKRAGEGQPCNEVGCEDGLLCDYEVDVCRAPPGPGSACLYGECARGSFCEVDVCVVAEPIGAPCTGHRQCETGFCPAGFCDRRPRLGEGCADALVCEVGASCDGQVCRASVTRGPAVCVYEGW